MAAIPADLWHAGWSPPRVASAAFPRVDAPRHMALIGATPPRQSIDSRSRTGTHTYTHPSMTRSAGRATTRTVQSPSLRRSTRRGAGYATAAGMTLASHADREEDTDMCVPAIRRMHDPATAGRMFETCGETFVSYHDAERYRQRVVQESESMRHSARRRAFVETLASTHMRTTGSYAGGGPRAATLFLGSAIADGVHTSARHARGNAADASPAKAGFASARIVRPDDALAHLDNPDSEFAAAMRAISALERERAQQVAYSARTRPEPVARQRAGSSDSDRHAPDVRRQPSSRRGSVQSRSSSKGGTPAATRNRPVSATPHQLSTNAQRVDQSPLLSPITAHADSTLLASTLEGLHSESDSPTNATAIPKKLQYGTVDAANSDAVAASAATTTSGAASTDVLSELEATRKQLAVATNARVQLEHTFLEQIEDIAAAAQNDLKERESKIEDLEATVAKLREQLAAKELGT